MKKIICILIVLFALCGCGGKKVEEIKLGETVSTDMIDFTFDSAQLSYYASSVLDETYASPVEMSSGIYVASAGHVLVCMEFTVTNKDRASLNMGPATSDWPLNFEINYKGELYTINGYDLNIKMVRDF